MHQFLAWHLRVLEPPTLVRMGGVRWCVALLVALLAAAEGYRILVIFPIPGKSHSLLGEGHVKLLLERGHEVTYITPFPVKPHKNLTQVIAEMDMSKAEEFQDVMNINSLLKGNSMLRDPIVLMFMAKEMGRMALSSENVKNFISDPKPQFDVVLAEWFYTELYAGFSALYQSPLVWFSSMDVHPMILRVVDDWPNPAYNPDVFSYSHPPFTFFERVKELWEMLKKAVLLEFLLISKTTEVYKEIFGAAAAQRGVELPPYNQLIYNSSMTLANSHASLGQAPKLAQNIKEIGGYHIKPTIDPLPKNLQKILDEAKHGVIYFSMGSNMKSKDMPADMKRDLLKMFGELKQTVLWKFEENIEGVPSNVHIQSWVPQHSVLAHPNTKLFITHGGLLSTTETIHFGVPVIVIPLFGDQFLNADAAARRGFAVVVQFTYSLASDLRTAIQEAFGNPKYSDRVKQLSAIYHDRPLSPADELVYWIEYAVRTGGAPHLRSPALLVSWYQKLYLDLLALVLAVLLIIVLLLKKLFGRRKQPDLKKKLN